MQLFIIIVHLVYILATIYLFAFLFETRFPSLMWKSLSSYAAPLLSSCTILSAASLLIPFSYVRCRVHAATEQLNHPCISIHAARVHIYQKEELEKHLLDNDIYSTIIYILTLSVSVIAAAFLA